MPISRYKVSDTLLGNSSDPRQGAGVIGFKGRSVYDKLSEVISVKDFKAVGDGVNDDTAAFRRALNAAAAVRGILFIPSGNYKITSGLETPLGIRGIKGEGELASILQPTGSGYTALLINVSGEYGHFGVGGDNQTLNGVHIAGQFADLGRDATGFVLSDLSYIRVTNCDGFGFKIENAYDCSFNAISVQHCGNSTHYAFSVNCVNGETSNMSTFNRLQAEFSNEKAMYIHPDTVSCVFSNIHSERTLNGTTDSWVFGGNCCYYAGVRIHTYSGSGNARIYATGTAIHNLLSEDTSVTWEATVSGGQIALVSPRILTTLSAISNQIGVINIFAPDIATLQGQALKYRIYGGQIGTLRVGYAGASDPSYMKLFGTAIGELISDSAGSAATFINCNVTTATSLPVVTKSETLKDGL